MRIFGIDFTSRPARRKPITCLVAELDGTHLVTQDLLEWENFTGFERMLRNPGPWIAGCDFPFGFARRFIETIGWPATWHGYVEPLGHLTRREFRVLLDDYRRDRPTGDKEHRRAADIASGANSRQTLYGTPVGLMLFEGAPGLLQSWVNLPGLQQGEKTKRSS